MSTRSTLVIVDPNEGRRRRYAQLFRRYFDVYEASNAALAVSTVKTMGATVMVAHMEQEHGTGLELCTKARDDARDVGCLLVVHGRDPDTEQTSTLMVRARASHSAHLVLAQEVSPEMLLRSIVRRLKGGPAIHDLPTARVEYWSATRQGISQERKPASPLDALKPERLRQALKWKVVAGAMTRPLTPLIDELPGDRDPTWKEAALAKANRRNLIRVLNMTVTPLVRQLPQDRDPTLAEMLRAQVTTHNLEIIWRRANRPMRQAA